MVNSLCVLCNRDIETANNLFFECYISRSIWNQCYKWFGELTVQHQDPKNHFNQFTSLRLTKLWNLVWGYIYVDKCC